MKGAMPYASNPISLVSPTHRHLAVRLTGFALLQKHGANLLQHPVSCPRPPRLLDGEALDGHKPGVLQELPEPGCIQERPAAFCHRFHEQIHID